MRKFLRQNIDFFLLVSLFLWVSYCSIINMGAIAGVVFLLFVVAIALKSSRGSFCLMISLLFCPMASLNIPSPIIISSAIIFLFNITRLNLKSKKIAYKRLIIPVVLYLLIRLLSYTHIVNFDSYLNAISVDLITIVTVILALLIINAAKDVEFIEHWIGTLGVLATLLGFVYFMFNDIAYISSLYADTVFAGKGVIGDDAYKAWLRWVPIDKEPNFWGAFLMFPLGYWINRVSKNASLISVLGLSITYLGIMFSYSRSSFVVSSFVLFYALFRNNRKYFFRSVLVFVLIALGVYYYSHEVVDRILTISGNISDEGGSGRFELWKEAINNFASNPIFGIGTGQTSSFSRTHMGTHNLYLQILGENGIVGLSVFLFIWLSAFVKMKKYMKLNGFYFYAILGFSLNVMTVHCFDLRIPFLVILLFYVASNSSIKPPILAPECSKLYKK